MVCNKRTIEASDQGRRVRLARPHPRRGLIKVYEPAVDAVLDTKRAEAIGQFDLFGVAWATPTPTRLDDVFAVRVPDGEWDKKVLLQFEREMLGLYVSDHPLFGVEHILAAAADITVAARCRRRGRAGEPQTVTLAGILSVGEPAGHQGRRAVGPGVLEDLEGSIEVMFFPATYAQVALQHRRGRDRRGQGPHRRPRGHRQADRQRPDACLDTTRGAARPGRGAMAPARCTPPLVDRLKDVLATHPGTTEVHLRLVNGERRTCCGSATVPGHAVGGADGRPQGAARAGRDLGLRRELELPLDEARAPSPLRAGPDAAQPGWVASVT